MMMMMLPGRSYIAGRDSAVITVIIQKRFATQKKKMREKEKQKHKNLYRDNERNVAMRTGLKVAIARNDNDATRKTADSMTPNPARLHSSTLLCTHTPPRQG